MFVEHIKILPIPLLGADVEELRRQRVDKSQTVAVFSLIAGVKERGRLATLWPLSLHHRRIETGKVKNRNKK